MVTNNAIHSNLAIPPGEYLEEVLDELGMTKDELARRMGRPATKLSQIFKGGKAITSDTALQLEMVTGVPAHIWTGLEAEYRLTLARQEQVLREDQLTAETKLVANYPYNELVKAGEIRRHTKPVDRVLALQEYFGVMSLESVLKLKRYNVAFRSGKTARGERKPEAIAAWLRMGERRAQRMHCSPFSEDQLIAALDDLRAMTRQTPDEFQEPLRSLLADCGIALVICPHFSKTKTHGATFWLGGKKGVLMITIRGKWADIFWFSLFHEIGHILLHGRQTVILEDDREDNRETEADVFAADKLIPLDAYQNFIQTGEFYQKDIVSLAEEIDIDPGIVVGRLQHDELLRHQWGNDLRSRYTWTKPDIDRVGTNN